MDAFVAVLVLIIVAVVGLVVYLRRSSREVIDAAEAARLSAGDEDGRLESEAFWASHPDL